MKKKKESLTDRELREQMLEQLEQLNGKKPTPDAEGVAAKKLLTTKDIADMFRVNVSTVVRWRKTPDFLPFVVIKDRKSVV